MAVALGEGGVKTLEDLAGLVPDDIRGWYENKGGERIREPGVLDSFSLSPEDAEGLIMRARVVAGWIEPDPIIENELAKKTGSCWKGRREPERADRCTPPPSRREKERRATSPASPCSQGRIEEV